MKISRIIKISFLTFIFLFTLSLKAQQNESAFQNGEWLKFKVRYGIFNASYATINLKEETLNAEKVYHAIGKGSTTGLARLFFKVDDVYESYFGKKDGKPRVFVRDIHEGGYTKKLKIYFNHQEKKAKIDNIKNNVVSEIGIPLGIQDLISGFYALRNNPKLEDIQTGQEIAMDMLFDDDEVFKFKLRFLGRENVKTDFGTIRTLMFRPLVQDGRVFKEEESLTIWITDDQNKIPVKIKASLRVGALVAELNSFGELKYPTELKK